VDETKKERLEALRTARAARDKAAADAADERELAAEELHAALAGPDMVRGVDFEIVTNPFGVYAIRKPDNQAILNWDNATKGKKLSLDWQIGILRNYILPDKAKGIEWAQVAAQRPGLAWDTSNAFMRLMGVVVEETEKK
jgi:hypothetical protein